MGRRYWVAAIAFGLTLFAFQARSQEAARPIPQEKPATVESEPEAEFEHADTPPKADQNAKYYSELIERIAGELIGIKEEMRNLKPEENETERTEDKKRKDRDLQAQEDMAFWAKWMLWVTCLTVVVGIGGVVYVRWALLETRRLGKIQMRAYLSCEGGKFWLKEKMIVFELYLTNRGQSPLLNGRFDGTIVFFGERGGSRTNANISGGFGPITAGGGDGVCMLITTYSRIDDGDLEGQRAGVSKLQLINARIRWLDVFGDVSCIDLSLNQSENLDVETVDGRRTLTGKLRAITVSAHNTGKCEYAPTLHEKIRAAFGRRAD